MYCPKCGSETVDGARFCRTCGQDVAVVHEALTGRLPAGSSSAPAPYDPTRAEAASKMLAASIRHGSMGVAFVVITLCILLFAPAGQIWGFWMLLPAFTMLGKSASDFVNYRAISGAGRAALPAPSAVPQPHELAAPSFTESLPPASVTEQTTRHLDKNRAQ